PGLAVEKSLRLRTAEIAQHGRLLFRLDTLCGHGHAERLAKRNDGLDDGLHRLLARHVAHELPIDLDLVEGEAREIAEARITGAEIVHHDLDPELAQAVELAEHLFERARVNLGK